MQVFGWIANRLVAALAGTLAVTAGASVAWIALYSATCGGKCISSIGEITGALWAAFVTSALFGAPVAALAGFIALTASPARARPWRSLPALVSASIAGVAVAFGIIYLSPPPVHAPGSAILWNLYILPAIFGLAAAVNIRRLPGSLRI